MREKKLSRKMDDVGLSEKQGAFLGVLMQLLVKEMKFVKEHECSCLKER